MLPRGLDLPALQFNTLPRSNLGIAWKSKALNNLNNHALLILVKLSKWNVNQFINWSQLKDP